jgi:prevent-host-death family protein
MITANVHEAKANLSKLLERVLEGEEVVIARRNVPLVKLVPVKEPAAERIGWARGLAELAPDFDEPLDDFSEYLELTDDSEPKPQVPSER